MNKESEVELSEFIQENESCYSIKKIYDRNDMLSVIQILDEKERICKCLFFNKTNITNVSIYNPETGKEIKNITYRDGGKTICSVREYDTTTEKLLNVIFFKPDGKSPSSIIEYNDLGNETQFTMFNEVGEAVTQCL